MNGAARVVFATVSPRAVAQRKVTEACDDDDDDDDDHQQYRIHRMRSQQGMRRQTLRRCRGAISNGGGVSYQCDAIALSTCVVNNRMSRPRH